LDVLDVPLAKIRISKSIGSFWWRICREISEERITGSECQTLVILLKFFGKNQVLSRRKKHVSV